MPMIECPSCGEDEELTGEQRDGRRWVTCHRCGHEWDRDVRPRCRLCGSSDLEAVPTSMLEEAGRGEQRTPSGIRDAYLCWDCGARDATSNEPVPAEPGWKQRRAEFGVRWRER